jgi:hypothetical protein
VSLCLSSGSITFHRGETLDQAQGVLVAERSDLYGEGESRAETLLRRGREREREKGAAQHVDIDDEKVRKDDHRQMYSYATDSAERESTTITAYLGQLALVDDADELVGYDLHHLLPQQSSSTACQHTRERRGD